jgi:hypothetical protein
MENKTLARLTRDLQAFQHNIDKQALNRLRSIKASVASIQTCIKWLDDHRGQIARPPHSNLSDYSDQGLSRFAGHLAEQARLLLKVSETLKADLLKTYGEPEAIKRVRAASGANL